MGRFSSLNGTGMVTVPTLLVLEFIPVQTCQINRIMHSSSFNPRTIINQGTRVPVGRILDALWQLLDSFKGKTLFYGCDSPRKDSRQQLVAANVKRDYNVIDLTSVSRFSIFNEFSQSSRYSTTEWQTVQDNVYESRATLCMTQSFHTPQGSTRHW